MSPSGSASPHGHGLAPSLFAPAGPTSGGAAGHSPPEGQRILSALGPTTRAVVRHVPAPARPAVSSPSPAGVLAASALGSFVTLCLVAAAAWWWIDHAAPRTPARAAQALAAVPGANPRTGAGAVVEAIETVAPASTRTSPSTTPSAVVLPSKAPTTRETPPPAAPRPAERAGPARAAAAPERAAARKDSDVDLLQALMSHLDKAPSDAAGASQSVLPAAGPAAPDRPTLQRQLAACRGLSGVDLTQCRTRACAGQWGAHALCPAQPAADALP